VPRPVSRTRFLLLLAAGGLVTWTSGALDGRLTRRWGAGPGLAQAAERLAQLPEACGDWQLVQQFSLDEQTTDMLACAGYVNRAYLHPATGRMVRVAVLLGPSGPISVHTPEVCYSSRNYARPGERQRLRLKDRGATEHQFWTVALRANDVDARMLLVSYAWSEGGPWQAPAHPRLHFSGQPRLYKLQLAVPGDAVDDPLQMAAVRDFLADFLPLIGAHLAGPKSGTEPPPTT